MKAAGRALITGASGLVGRHLVATWGEPQCVVVGRDRTSLGRRFPQATAVAWDGLAPLPDGTLDGVDAVFHLAGEPVAEGRWNAAKKARIRESREAGTRAIVDSIEAASSRPRVLVSASAVGFYGDRGDTLLDENSTPGTGFLVDVCRAWEEEASRATALGVRVITLRIGIVLARDGGALAKLVPLFRAGLGGPLGGGRHWVPWIHLSDVVNLAIFASRSDESGIFNATAPAPVTNAVFTEALAHVLHRYAKLPTPAFALRLALGEMADVVLGSQRAMPARALASGYAFQFPELKAALRDVVST